MANPTFDFYSFLMEDTITVDNIQAHEMDIFDIVGYVLFSHQDVCRLTWREHVIQVYWINNKRLIKELQRASKLYSDDCNPLINILMECETLMSQHSMGTIESQPRLSLEDIIEADHSDRIRADIQLFKLLLTTIYGACIQPLLAAVEFIEHDVISTLEAHVSTPLTYADLLKRQWYLLPHPDKLKMAEPAYSHLIQLQQPDKNIEAYSLVQLRSEVKTILSSFDKVRSVMDKKDDLYRIRVNLHSASTASQSNWDAFWRWARGVKPNTQMDRYKQIQAFYTAFNQKFPLSEDVLSLLDVNC